MSNCARIEDALLRRADDPPQVEALVDGERSFDYASLTLWATRFAGELTRSGVGPGDRVATYLEHASEQIVALYAAWIAGAVAVPVNPSLKTAQVAHILRHCGCRLLVTDRRKLAQLAADAYAGIGTLDVAPLAALAGHGSSQEVSRELPGGDAPAAILYTSGSTGRPKGILVSHANLIAGARIVASYLGIQSDERILSVLPFSFDYGLNQLLTAVRCGCTLVLQRSHFPADVCRALERHRITALAGVPSLWIQLMERQSPLSRMELPLLRYITNSGGAFPTELVRRYRERWPHVRIYLMYGLSEAFRSTYLPPDEIDRRPDSMGKPIPETEVLVIGADGECCAPGEQGELVHRGPTVALGYWNDAEATARVFRSDPLDPDAKRAVVYSSDIVRRDQEGFLYFVGRSDQLIKSYGYRVSPEEVEELIYASRLVAEVVVHGRPDAVAGASIVAHVVPVEPGLFEPRALLEYCRANMPAYMVPKVIEVHDGFPRTASGKVDRKALAG